MQLSHDAIGGDVQYLTELMCETGRRDTPFLAHYPAAALMCRSFLSEAAATPELTEQVQATERKILAFPELQDIRANSVYCGHKKHDRDLRQMMIDSFSILRRSAHTQINTSTLLKVAIRNPEVNITCRMLDGASSLIDSCLKERPEPRYLGQEIKYWTAPTGSTFDSLGEAAGSVAALFSEVQPDSKVEGVKYFLNGEKLHALTHLHALAECRLLYENEMVQEGLKALRLQVKLSAQKAEGIGSLGVDEDAAAIDLTKPNTWQEVQDYGGDLGVPHALKRLYAVWRLGSLGFQQFNDIMPTLQTAIKNG